MKYIISPIPLKDIPHSQEELYKIDPFIISPISSKRVCISLLAYDISYIGLYYNIPLYVYIMNNSFYNSTINYSTRRLVSNKQYHLNSTNQNQFANHLDLKSQYYYGILENIQDDIENLIFNVNFFENPCISMRLTVENGLTLI